MRIESVLEYAVSCGRSSRAILAACRPGRPLAAAYHRGRGVDADHPAAVSYRESRRVTAQGGKRDAPRIPPATIEREAALRMAMPPRGRGAPEPAGIEAPQHILDLLGMTVGDVLRAHGTDTRFREWLTAVKLIAEIDDRRLRSSDRRGEVVDRELVRTHVIGAIDDALARLVTDSPRTIATRVRDLVEAGAEVEQLEIVVRELISQQIRAMKDRALRGLARG